MNKLSTFWTGSTIAKILVVVVGIIAIAVLAAYIHKKYISPPAPIGLWELARISPIVKNVPTHVAENVKIVYLDKPKAVDKLKLDQTIMEKPNLNVVDAVKVSPRREDQTIVTIHDSVTGEVTHQTRVEPAPWVKLTGDASVTAEVLQGITGRDAGTQLYRAGAQYDFVRVGGVDISVKAEVNNKLDTYVGVKATYVFQ